MKCELPLTSRLAMSAAPRAPISPGNGASVTSFPTYSSMARRTAKLRKVPPWTTIFSPSSRGLEIRTTLVNTFSMMLRQSPAIRSCGSLPLRCSWMMVEFMKTVQRLPRRAGALDWKAASAISVTGISSVAAKFSRKEPQPEEQASLSIICVMTPSLIQMAFISCPPMSRMKLTSGVVLRAPVVWAMVSTVWMSAPKAEATICSP